MFGKWIYESEFDKTNDFLDNSVMSVRKWLAVLSIMMIPVVNLVMIFLWAFAKKRTLQFKQSESGKSNSYHAYNAINIHRPFRRNSLLWILFALY